MEFRFCPYCGTPLVSRHVFGKPRSACPECGFVHFRDPKVAVIGVVTADDRVLLVRRAAEPARGKWALPGGVMDAGEMPKSALARELMEEVGLEVEVKRFLGIFPMVTTSGIAGGIVIAYHVRALGAESTPLEHNDDVDAAAWFAGEELPDRIAFESSTELLSKWQEGRL